MWQELVLHGVVGLAKGKNEESTANQVLRRRVSMVDVRFVQFVKRYAFCVKYVVFIINSVVTSISGITDLITITKQ